MGENLIINEFYFVRRFSLKAILLSKDFSSSYGFINGITFEILVLIFKEVNFYGQINKILLCRVS